VFIDRSLKKFDLNTGQLGEEIFKAEEKTPKIRHGLDANFAYIKEGTKIIRVNLNDGQTLLINQAAQGNDFYGYSIHYLPAISSQIMIISGDRDEGIYIHNLSNNNLIFNHKYAEGIEEDDNQVFGEEEDHFSQTAV